MVEIYKQTAKDRVVHLQRSRHHRHTWLLLSLLFYSLYYGFSVPSEMKRDQNEAGCIPGCPALERDQIRLRQSSESRHKAGLNPYKQHKADKARLRLSNIKNNN